MSSFTPPATSQRPAAPKSIAVRQKLVGPSSSRAIPRVKRLFFLTCSSLLLAHLVSRHYMPPLRKLEHALPPPITRPGLIRIGQVAGGTPLPSGLDSRISCSNGRSLKASRVAAPPPMLRVPWPHVLDSTLSLKRWRLLIRKAFQVWGNRR